MSSKINGFGPGQVGNGVPKVNTEKTAGDKTPQLDATLGETTTVSLTNDALALGRLDQALKAIPDIDAVKVDSIKTAIANGEYQVDTAQLAEALIKFDQGLE